MLVAEVDLIDRFFNFLRQNPSPQEMLTMSATEEENERFQFLSEKKANGRITTEEIQELGYFLKAEHLIRMAKIDAYGQIQGRNGE